MGVLNHMPNRRMIFVLFSVAILFSMVREWNAREWNAPVSCSRANLLLPAPSRR
jgi:hypothetical protein